MKLPSRAINMRYHNGYVSVLILPALAGLLMLLLGVVSQQHKLQQRWHLQSAADTMAHSAATIMAREFNLLAVLNRALIANQVAQAQLLGLSSWYRNLATATDRLALVSSWIPYLNVVTRHLANATRYVNTPLQTLLSAGLLLQRALVESLRIAQIMVRYSFAMIIPKTMAELAQLQNIPEHKWTLLHSPGLVQFPWLWWTFIPLQSAARDKDLLADLVRHSRDSFSQHRTYTWFNVGLIKAQKTGGTDLVVSQQGSWSWQSMDTVALHVRILFGREEIPWGNGVTHTDRRVKRLQSQRFGGSARKNPRTARWALTEQHSLGGMSTPSYFNREELEPAHWPSVIIQFDDVVAKAGIRFSRPHAVFPRRDTRRERANLFNALWEPELQSLTRPEKLIISQLREQQS
ncbi:hypothetical protein [Pseudidiomarina gelatinasegens]|uniref:hypothetical protein n=1 Tax=Pseudidiomarina gelatinasegens TaxID=2487740 RepID=UPI003A980D13